ncbi:nucleoside hydrolase [Jannaschia sp. R86511]|uniref:nucleoside hydrolase n=1 Tax=Jannaschia sp. R86511 TaxID=3093853 RepID=UPI0036D2DCC7
MTAVGPGQPVVLDVDTGVDDALALLYALACDRLDLRAVTCVGGNAPLPEVLANTLAVMTVGGGGDVPVLAGHAHPATGPRAAAEAWHGADGLMGCRPDPAEPPGRPAGGPPAAPSDAPAVARASTEHAVAGLAALLRSGQEPVTLVPLGPHTNVADLLLRHPDEAARLRAVHFMGGSGVGGNVTAAAEFNVHHDPEATAVVLAAPVPVSMYGLDVFEQVRLPRADVERLRASVRPALALAGRLCAASAARSGTDDAGLGDAGAVAALVRPDLVGAVRRPVAVQVGEGPGRGATVVDRRPRTGDDPDGAHLVDVVETVDGPALARHWLDTLLAAYG